MHRHMHVRDVDDFGYLEVTGKRTEHVGVVSFETVFGDEVVNHVPRGFLDRLVERLSECSHGVEIVRPGVLP